MAEFEDYTLVAMENALSGTLQTTIPGNGIIASTAEAIAGLSDNTIMTPLKVQQALAPIVFNFAPLNQAVPLGNQPATWVLTRTGTGDYDFGWQANPASGTVTAISIASANGLAGSSDGNASTPTLTLSTTVTGLLKGNGTAISAASAGTDYLSPADIGVTVQAYSANLASWSGVTRASGFDAFVATPSSANLAALVTNETGSGALVFATSPTLVTPNLGTPSAIDLTNATNVPRQQPRVTATASTATLTPNSATTDIAAVTAQAAGLTIAAPTGSPVDGQQLTIRVRDNGTTRALTWNAAYVPFASGQLPTATVINKTHYFIFSWNATTSVWELIGGNPVAGLWGA